MPKKYSHQEVSEYIKSKGCTLLSKIYSGNRTPMEVICIGCGEVYKVTFDHFKRLKKYRCNKCSGKFHHGIDVLREVIKAESECCLISETYTNNHSKIRLKCRCGNEFETTFKIFNRGKKQCDNCSNESMSNKMCKSHDDFVREVTDIYKGEFLVVGEYKNTAQKLSIKHNKCNHIWSANPSDILHKKSGCPYCNESKGEKRVEAFLYAHNIKYTHQYKINECKNKRALPFDFAIFDNNNVLKFLCEYDGILHYKYKFQNEKEYNLTKTRDEIKNKYCVINNIKLIRIPYYELDNIEKILKSALP